MITTLLCSALLAPVAGQATLVLKPDAATVKVSPSLYGIFFEEINHAGDGGIYSELLMNRGFEAGENGKLPPNWLAGKGTSRLDSETPFNSAKPRSLRIDAGSSVVNHGYWGIHLVRGTSYRLVIYTRGGSSKILVGGREFTVPASEDWKRHEMTLSAKETTAKGTLEVVASESEPTWLGWASLTPAKLWKRSALRKDLADMVGAMKPTFVRFPGGCFVEGQDLGRAFDWQATLGAPETRPGKDWRFWGYSSTDGLGYHEYLQWCEDLGAAPLYVVNAGISHSQMEPMETMDKYVQSAVDAIEYANGPVTSKWGALRAKNGHPKPFGLKYIEIGNENGYNWSFGGPKGYADRYQPIYNAIKAKYPNIITIADDKVPYPMEMIDEHYYSSPSFFWQNANRYDSYSRKGPKIYVGEYAVTQGAGTGNLDAALGEAAYMTGLERNSDVVKMASYAPLFVNVNQKQWNPNAIVFDASRSYGTPSYWVQALFAQNRADRVVPMKVSVETEKAEIYGGYGLETWRTRSEYKDLKASGQTMANTGQSVWRSAGGQWSENDGVISQGSLAENARYFHSGLDLKGRFTIEVKGRRMSGEEGVILIFGVKGEGDYIQWNVGGWGNTKAAFEVTSGGSRTTVGQGVPMTLETGRWYDVKVEGDGDKVRGYLDGKLVEEVTIHSVPNFVAVAGLDDKTKETVIKIVNGSSESRAVRIDLGYEPSVKTAKAITLTGPSLASENSFDKPELIAPRTSQFAVGSRVVSYKSKPLSVTVLRIPR